MRNFIIVMSVVILLTSCGEVQKKPAFDQTNQKQNIAINSENNSIDFNNSRDKHYLDLTAKQIRQQVIELKPKSDIKSIHLTVLYEDRVLIGERTITVQKKYFYESFLVKINPLKISIPFCAKIGEKVIVYGESDKGTKCRIEFILQDELPELSLKMTEEQKRDGIIKKYENQMGIKKILINEFGHLAFIDNENYLIVFQILDINDSYRANSRINIGNVNLTTVRRIKQPGIFDTRFSGLSFFGFESGNVMYFISDSLEKKSFRTLTKPLTDGSRKIYLLEDKKFFVSIDDNQTISDVFVINQEHAACSYSKKYPDTFFVEFPNPDGPSFPKKSYSIIDGTPEEHDLGNEESNLISIGD